MSKLLSLVLCSSLFCFMGGDAVTAAGATVPVADAEVSNQGLSRRFVLLSAVDKVFNDTSDFGEFFRSLPEEQKQKVAYGAVAQDGVYDTKELWNLRRAITVIENGGTPDNQVIARHSKIVVRTYERELFENAADCDTRAREIEGQGGGYVKGLTLVTPDGREVDPVALFFLGLLAYCRSRPSLNYSGKEGHRPVVEEVSASASN